MTLHDYLKAKSWAEHKNLNMLICFFYFGYASIEMLLVLA
jgi:hypothetical protein